MATRKKAAPQKKKKPETWEEFLAEAWGNFLLHYADQDIPQPGYLFRVGESILYGAREEVRVEEVHDHGRILVISYHDRGTTYGKPWDNHRRLPSVMWWVHLTPIEPVQPTSFNRPRIFADSYHNHLGAFLDTTYNRGLIDSPIYQRDYVWTLADKQRLIGSVFARNDIGKFVLLQHATENRLEIVDGKQRIGALREFREGRFEYEGYNWFQLSGMDKFSFNDLTISYVQLDSTRVAPTDILRLFLDLNEGGVPQAPEHVAKVRALYEKAKAGEVLKDFPETGGTK